MSHSLGVKCPPPLLGDHGPAPRAGQQRIPARLSRCCQGERQGGDDHLLPHQRSPGQLTTERATAAWHPLQRQDRDCRQTECSARRLAQRCSANTLGTGDGRQRRVWPVCMLSCTQMHTRRMSSTTYEGFFEAAREITKPSCLRTEVTMLVFMSNSTSISSGVVIYFSCIWIFGDDLVQKRNMYTQKICHLKVNMQGQHDERKWPKNKC